MLLATSMVLTSVNVAPIFADEEISFGVEENFTTEDDASVDADFGDVVVEDTAAEDETYADEVVEGDTFVGDDLVAEGESYLDEDAVVEDDGVIDETFAGNEDVLEAVQASEDAGYANTIVDVTNEVVVKTGDENFSLYDVGTTKTIYIAKTGEVVDLSSFLEPTYKGSKFEVASWDDKVKVDTKTATIGTTKFDGKTTDGETTYHTIFTLNYEVVDLTTLFSNEITYTGKSVWPELQKLLENANAAYAAQGLYVVTPDESKGYLKEKTEDSAGLVEVGPYNIALAFVGTTTNNKQNLTVRIARKPLTYTQGIKIGEKPLTAENNTVAYPVNKNQIVISQTYYDGETEITELPEEIKDSETYKGLLYELKDADNNKVEGGVSGLDDTPAPGTYEATPITSFSTDNYTVTNNLDDSVTSFVIDGEISLEWYLDDDKTALDSPKSITYDGKPHAISTNFDNIVDIDGTKSTTAKTSASNDYYTLKATVKKDLENIYTIKNGTETFQWRVAPVPVTARFGYKDLQAGEGWTYLDETVTSVKKPYTEKGYEVDVNDDKTIILKYTKDGGEEETYKGSALTASGTYVFTPEKANTEFTPSSFTFTIEPEDTTITISADAWIEYGSPASTELTAYYNGVDINGKKISEKEVNCINYHFDGELTDDQKKALSYDIVGKYTTTTKVRIYEEYIHVDVTGLEDPDFKGTTSGSLRVTPKPLTVNWQNEANDYKNWFYYNGDLKTFSAELNGVINNDVVELIVRGNTGRDRGKYTATAVRITGRDADNYAFEPESEDWFIVDSMSAVLEYNGEEQTITVPSTGEYKFFDEDLKWQWSTSERWYKHDKTPDKATKVLGSWVDAPPTYKDAGTYYIYYSIKDSKGVYQKEDAKGNPYFAVLEITPRATTATLKEETVTVGTEAKDFPKITGDSFTFAKKELATGDSGKDFTVNAQWDTDGVKFYPWSSDREQWSATSVDFATAVAKVGKYRVDFTGEKNTGLLTGNANYTLSYGDAVLNVIPATLKIKWYPDLEYTGRMQFYAGAQIVGEPYIAVVEGNYAKNVGSYTATIVDIVDIYGNPVKNYTISEADKTHEWKITKKNVKVAVELVKARITYGDADPTSTWGLKDLTVYGVDKNMKIVTTDVASKSELSGTPVFETNYMQYSDITNKSGLYTAGKDYYKVTVSGLTSDNYNIVGYETGKLYVDPAKVTITPNNVVQGYGEATQELTYSFSGAKTAAENDVNKKFVVSLSTDPKQPREIGTYTISAKVDYFDADHPTLDPKYVQQNIKFTLKTARYDIVDGKLNIKFDNYRAEYDAKDHGISITPYPLPSGVEIYFTEAFETADDFNAFVEEIENRYRDNSTKRMAARILAAIKADKRFTTTYLTYKAADTNQLVGYYVSGPNYGLSMFGSNTVEILSNDQAQAEAVDALIKKAVASEDPADVKAARDAYEALTAAGKKLVDPILYKKLLALEEKTAKAQAEAIKALLPADPSKATDKDRENYDKAEALYDALSDAAKALIPDTKKALDTAKAAIEADEAAKEKAFVEAVAKLPAPADAKASDRAAVDAAKAQYDALTPTEKANADVKDAKAKLDLVDAAVKAAEEGEDADKAAAQKVADMINALPAPEDVTVADENAIENAVKALDALTDAQEALVPDVAKEKLAADVLALAAAMVKEAEDQAAADEIEALIDAIAKSEPGDGKTAMKAAKDAFDNATADVQAKVDKGHQEVLASAVKYYTMDTTFEAGRGVYRVLSNGDVTYVKPLYPEDTYFQVPNDVVCRDGFPFKVVKVSVNAFKGCTNVTKIWMGKNIVTIGKYAFKGATNLRTLIVRTQAIDVTEKIENAFAGMAANRKGKVNVQIWEKMLSKYEPMFRGAGKLPAKAYFTTIG